MSVRRDAPVSAPKQQGRLYAALDAGVGMRLSTASIGCYEDAQPALDKIESDILSLLPPACVGQKRDRTTEPTVLSQFEILRIAIQKLLDASKPAQGRCSKTTRLQGRRLVLAFMLEWQDFGRAMIAWKGKEATEPKFVTDLMDMVVACIRNLKAEFKFVQPRAADEDEDDATWPTLEDVREARRESCDDDVVMCAFCGASLGTRNAFTQCPFVAEDECRSPGQTEIVSADEWWEDQC